MTDTARVKREQKPALEPRPTRYSYSAQVSLQHERLVGRVVILWSKLEAAMQETVWYFLKLQIDDGRVVTSRLEASNLMMMLRRLADLHLEDSKKIPFLNVLTKLEDRRDDRNFIVHGTWGTFGNLKDPLAGQAPIAMSLRPNGPDQTQLVSETFPSGRMCTIVDGIKEGLIFFIDFLASHDPSRDARSLGHLRP